MTLENAGLYGVFLYLKILSNSHFPVVYFYKEDVFSFFSDESAQFGRQSGNKPSWPSLDFLGTRNNIYVYIIFNSISDEIFKISISCEKEILNSFFYMIYRINGKLYIAI